MSLAVDFDRVYDSIYYQVFPVLESWFHKPYIEASKGILEASRKRRCARAGEYGLKTTKQGFLEMCRFSHSRAWKNNTKTLQACRRCYIGRWNTAGHAIIPENIQLIQHD